MENVPETLEEHQRFKTWIQSHQKRKNILKQYWCILKLGKIASCLFRKFRPVLNICRFGFGLLGSLTGRLQSHHHHQPLKMFWKSWRPSARRKRHVSSMPQHMESPPCTAGASDTLLSGVLGSSAAASGRFRLAMLKSSHRTRRRQQEKKRGAVAAAAGTLAGFWIDTGWQKPVHWYRRRPLAGVWNTRAAFVSNLP